MLRFSFKYKDLLFALATREIKVRYKQALLGIMWAVIQPVFRMLVFTFIFSQIGRLSFKDVPYPVFVFSGLVFWGFFIGSVDNAMFSLINNLDLVTKIYFPRIILPAASILACFVDFLISLALLFVMLIYFKVGINLSFVLLPVPFLIQLLLASGIALFFSALNVFYRDVRYAIPLILEITIFLTPVTYPLDAVPAKYLTYIQFNPLTNIFKMYRDIIFSGTMNPADIWFPLAAGCIVFVLGFMYFKHVENSFADIL